MAKLNKIEMVLGNDLPSELRQLELPVRIIEDILSVVEGLNHINSQRGYQSIFRYNPAGMLREMIGRNSDINIIPGVEAGICCPLAVALSMGDSMSHRYGLRNVMRAVRRHLIDCFQDTGVMMIVTDVWSPRLLEESLGDLQAHENQGKHILFFLVNGSKLTLVSMK